MMDYMTTAQEKDYWLSLRIRSPRAKKRALREDREKQLLKLERELHQISTLQHNMGYVPLDPPLQRGWKRTFVLRADVAASAKVAFYQGILDKINVTEYHHDRKFMVTKRVKGRKVKVVKELRLPELWTWHWDQCRFSEKEQKEFDLEQRFETNGRLCYKYVFRDKWRFVPKVMPNMITQVRLQSIELERREAWIENHFRYNDSRNTLRRLQGRRRRFVQPTRQQMQLKNEAPKNTLEWIRSLDA
ncbi:hypothetical protein [Chitinophaga sp. YIM B06452]|uniref:hypothetical protein n=1 Tax=Chitinophaga sp. YIM B06452 TaxID=3082158 RepID=UPI0031FE8417